MNEKTIFLTALEKQERAERAAYLDEACAGDQAMHQRIEALLRSHDEAGKFLDVPAVQQIAGPGPPPQPTDGTQAENRGEGNAPSLDFLAPSQKPGSLGRLGHYEVLEVVGHGGFGTVFKVFDEKLQRVAAIKVLAPGLATSGTACKRFVREAQAAAAVKNDHVMAIHGVENEHKPPYLVMELIDGISLQDLLDREGPPELRQILRIGMQTAEGLAAAHKQGLVHRDIKPANILLENGVQRVKITDFGLARAVDDASVTQSGVVAGTPQYMSPEQAEGLSVDHRSDLFSLGSVLYTLCTGRAPFRASGTMAVLKRVCEETPRPVREINPEIPDWLAAIIDKLHAKKPAERFQSAREVAELLEQSLAHLQQPSIVPLPPVAKTPAAPPADEDDAPPGTSGQLPLAQRMTAPVPVDQALRRRLIWGTISILGPIGILSWLHLTGFLSGPEEEAHYMIVGAADFLVLAGLMVVALVERLLSGSWRKTLLAGPRGLFVLAFTLVFTIVFAVDTIAPSPMLPAQNKLPSEEDDNPKERLEVGRRAEAATKANATLVVDVDDPALKGPEITIMVIGEDRDMVVSRIGVRSAAFVLPPESFEVIVYTDDVKKAHMESVRLNVNERKVLTIKKLIRRERKD